MIAETESGSADKHFPKSIRPWFYESTTSQLTTSVDGIASSLKIKGQPKNWAKVQIVPSESMKNDNKNTGKWRVEYCYLR